MKSILTVIFFALLPTFFLKAQVGIGTTNPNALLDIKSSNQATPTNQDGLLIPKVDEYPATNPAVAQDGMLVYATGDGSISKGFCFWDNTATSWVVVSNGFNVEKINDLLDGKSDNDSTNNGSSVFLGTGSGLNDDSSDNKNVGVGYQSLRSNTTGFTNAANGYQSLYSNTTGNQNTANGYKALYYNTTGSFNIANGVEALHSNTTGFGNVANGYQTLRSNTTGFENVANGRQAMYANTEGLRNTAVGYNSLNKNTDGDYNIAIGRGAGYFAQGNRNVFLGSNAGAGTALYAINNSVFLGNEAGYDETNSNRLYIENSSSSTPLIYGEFDTNLLRINGELQVGDPNTTGYKLPITDGAANQVIETNGAGALIWANNTGGAEKINDLLDGKSDNDGHSIFLGIDAGLNDDGTNNRNIGLGFNTLNQNVTGNENIAIGFQTLYNNLLGERNVANGYKTLVNNTNGSDNTAIGYETLRRNTTGNNNTALGFQTLKQNTDGDYNIGIGNKAGYFAKGDRNIFIGNEAGEGTANYNIDRSIFLGNQAGRYETNSDRLYIENSQTTTPLIYGEFDNDLLRVNGDFEVEKTADASITVKTPFGDKASLKLMETNGTDYGFEFEYDGSADKLHLWSRTFSGNEAERMTWQKNGNVGISTTTPNALLDLSSTNPAAPKNTDGMLVPRINAFPATNPGANQNGMLVFLTTDNKFYYWRNSTSSWVSVGGVQKINDLSDGKSDVDGSQNGSSVFLGINAGITDNNTDNRNVGIGFQTLQANSNGSTNTSVGYQSMMSNTSGYNNVAVGTESLFLNTSGHSNVALGDTSLYSNTSGDGNTAIGWEAMKNNLDGNYNIANGDQSLYSNTTGNSNVANGYRSLYSNTTGDYNVANGYQSLYSNSTGDANTAIGLYSLEDNTTGKDNVAVGNWALTSNTIFNYNTAIGSRAANLMNGFSNTTAIGADANPSSPNQVRLGNSSVSVIGGYAPWSNFSDRRIKINIKEDIKGLEFIKKLRPVSYNYDMDAIARFEKTPDKFRQKDAERLKAKEIQTGFIAQEVEAAAKEVGFNFHGVVKPYTKNDLYALSYSEFVVPLVKAVQEQQEEIEALKKEIQEIKKLLTNK